MKKIVTLFLSVLLINAFAYSQTAKKKWENPCPECLPGVSYGFEWPELPPITEPDPGTPPEILRWTGDLSVMMFQIGEILTLCRMQKVSVLITMEEKIRKKQFHSNLSLISLSLSIKKRIS